MPTIEVFGMSRKPIAASTESPSHLYARQQFDAGLQWLESRGVRIERHAISPHGNFATDNAAVKTAVELQGADSLPIVVLDGTIIAISGYPSRSELLASAGHPPSSDPGFVREKTIQATGMSAALAANNLAQFRNHYDRAQLLGISSDDLREMVESARAASRTDLRDETLTELEQLLASGPAGKPKASRCTCRG